ncbi:MAG: right-handed parallel beta-helix repeat-containing protein [Myxococcales bacterium]|nr:right-handed parallel beta-helix repeat-containing protein [Myxococcales bacterium]
MLTLLSVASFAAPTKWVVTVDGTPSLEEVLPQLGPYDTLDIGPGVYDVDITLGSLAGITIRGAGSGPGGTVLQYGDFNTLAWFNDCTDLRVEGLAIEGNNVIRPVSLVGFTTATFHDVRLANGIDFVKDRGAAGMYVGPDASVEISDSTFEGNVAVGNGALLVDGMATISSSRFVRNTAEQGGGVACGIGSSCVMTDCLFEGNQADQGGGLQLEAPVQGEVIRSVFCGNDATGTDGDGGGIMFVDATASVSTSHFLYNTTSDNGAGLYAQRSDVEVVNNTFIGNAAAHLGGSVYVWGTQAVGRLTNNLIVDSVATENDSAAAINARATGVTTGSHNLFWSNTKLDIGAGVTLDTTIAQTDPLLGPVAGSCDDALVTPDPAGPTHDGGTKLIRDPDGSISDIGATGGPLALRDRDDDGSLDGDDCDDLDPLRTPGRTEVCDDVERDEDCDGLINDADGSVDPSSFPSGFLDEDGDGVGGQPWQADSCIAPANLVEAGGDCDDSSALVFPGAFEECDNIDNDCDGAADEGCDVGRRDDPLLDPVAADGCSCTTSSPAAWAVLWLPALAGLSRRRQRPSTNGPVQRAPGRSDLRSPAITPLTVPNQ